MYSNRSLSSELGVTTEKNWKVAGGYAQHSTASTVTTEKNWKYDSDAGRVSGEWLG